ncbi:MAG: signal peptidase [Verrucomicrobiota bacterium]|jgi:signal peptidase I
MFTPKWKDEAKHLTKGARKFVHYKRDLLSADRIAEIESRRVDLLAAIKSGQRATVDEASKQLRAVCENALPAEKPLGWLEENVEVMFVAIVIALGLRAYYLQPFRIPTGSMQPTLNGIIGKPLSADQWPGFPQRMIEKILRGRSYVRVVNDKDRHIALIPRGPGGQLDFDIRDTQRMHFFSRSNIHFSDDSATLQLPAPKNPCYQAGMQAAVQAASRNHGLLPKGTVLCEGTIDTGDLVLVDKMSYHFRKPLRGEVFVFDTQGIRGIDERSGEQAKGSHYIKRLCGVPGDTLTIQSPHLLIDGKIAKEPGIQRVMRGEGPYAINRNGYGLADAREAQHGNKTLVQYLAKPGDSITLQSQTRPGQREYVALGDNTGNSLDSRYWGTVKEFNLVGPALFALWPVTTGHWGFIR